MKLFFHALNYVERTCKQRIQNKFKNIQNIEFWPCGIAGNRNKNGKWKI